MTEMADSLKTTSLHSFHIKNGARMVPFGGWDMPVQYSSILAEHEAVRKSVGLFDVSHMGEATVTGPQAREFLDFLVTNNVGALTPGRVVYSPMCYDNGTVVDDLLVYCRADDDFFLCINAGNTEKDMAWISSKAEAFECEVKHVSAEYSQIAVQGPNAEALLQELTDLDLSGIAYYHFLEGSVSGVDAIVSRTGYTGEDGFELYVPWNRGGELAESINTAGEKHGLVLAGLGARDSLRLEAGFPLYGHEINDERTPYEGGIGWTVKLKKPVDFVGKVALANQKAAGIPNRTLFYTMEDKRIARQGAAVFVGNECVGEVVSGTKSPILGKPIGSAVIKIAFISSENLEVDLRGKRYPITVKKPPLHK